METSVAHGTTLTVALPGEPVLAGTAPADRASAGVSPGRPLPNSTRDTALPSLRVLVAEDDEMQRELLLSCLPSPPLTVEVVADGGDVVEAATRLQPHVVLMDMEMPLLDGPDATRALREQEARTGQPRAVVVALSAHEDPRVEQRFREAGCDRYLVKPFDPDELLELLREIAPPPR